MTQHTDEPSVDELDALNEISRLLLVARRAASKIRAEMKRAGRTAYGSAEVDWLVNDTDNFLKTAFVTHRLYDAARARLTAQGQATREQVLKAVVSVNCNLADEWCWKDISKSCHCRRISYAVIALSPASPVEPRPQPDAAKIRKAALEEAAQLVDCGGCAGVDRLKDGTCVRATSSDCYQVLANEIRSLITADKQEGV